MNSITLHGIDWSVVIVYFVILLAIGIWASYFKRNKDKTLFLAGNSLGSVSIGFSMWGTNVGPSMLIASASAGFTSGVASGNFAWYAFVFIFLLAIVFAPRYLGAKVMTLPEFMGKRFGKSTRNILAWYSILTIIISWLALTLFAGGILIRQIFGFEMWISATILLLISVVFTVMGGLKAVAYINVFQMTLLIAVSLALTLVGLNKVGGVQSLVESVPSSYWNLFQPNSDPDFPWLAILLGYPVMGVWFWCTDQAMVQPVLGAKNLPTGQMGANFCGWMKILDVVLYILPGVICFALVSKGVFPALADPDTAYMAMVTKLFPVGMIGMVMAVLSAALVTTVASALNALSTLFTMDIYVQKYKPEATTREIIRIGRIVVLVGAVIAIALTLAIDSIKGLNLFNIFQSVLGFIAPPMAAVFLFGVFWKKTTTRAANMCLTWGTAFSLGTGILYFLTNTKTDVWPHFMMLSFLLFAVICGMMFVVTLLDRNPVSQDTLDFGVLPKTPRKVWTVWIALIVVMVGLYIVFNGH